MSTVHFGIGSFGLSAVYGDPASFRHLGKRTINGALSSNMTTLSSLSHDGLLQPILSVLSEVILLRAMVCAPAGFFRASSS